MADATRFQFNDPSVPKAYDELLVPRLFEPWAKLLLDEARLQPSESVLDIATAPGTVARLAAARLGVAGARGERVWRTEAHGARAGDATPGEAERAPERQAVVACRARNFGCGRKLDRLIRARVDRGCLIGRRDRNRHLRGACQLRIVRRELQHVGAWRAEGRGRDGDYGSSRIEDPESFVIRK